MLIWCLWALPAHMVGSPLPLVIGGLSSRRRAAAYSFRYLSAQAKRSGPCGFPLSVFGVTRTPGIPPVPGAASLIGGVRSSSVQAYCSAALSRLSSAGRVASVIAAFSPQPD